MLPYRFRNWGYVLIIASVLSLVLGLLMANVWEIIPQTNTRFISMVMYLLFFLGIFVIVMTEEKDEDEMIDSIRRRSIAATAFIAFGFFMVINLVMAFLHGFRSLQSMSFVSSLVTVLTGTGLTSVNTYIILYLIIFRISIWKMRKQCKEDQA
jgi:peptidoglycan/LPS O-acetylase OafA/YrhL